MNASAAMNSPPPLRLLVALVLVITLGPFCIEMFIPVMPDLAREFRADSSLVPLTLSVYMFGFAISHLFYGAAADHFGRRPVLTAGLAILLASTVGCALAQSLPALVGFRFLQAFGASAALIIPRAIVRDLYGPVESARVQSHMSTAMAIAPVIAPIMGGYLVERYSWHAVFWVIAAYGIIALACFRMLVPESVPKRGESGFSVQTLLRNKAALLADRRFLGYLLCMLFTACGLFAFVSLSPFILMEHMGVRKDHFGYLYGLAITGFMVGTILSGRLHGHVSGRRLVGIGIGLNVVGAQIMFALAAAGVMRPMALMAPHFIYLIGMGLLMPQSVAAALAPVPHIAATAAALMGFIQVATSAALVTLLGFFQEGGQVLVTFTMCVTSLCALLAYMHLVIGPQAKPPARPDG